jgi:hypothetical protein
MFAHKGNPRRSGRNGRRRGKGGIALLAGAAGLAYKNRQKLTSLLGRARGRGDRSPASA